MLCRHRLPSMDWQEIKVSDVKVLDQLQFSQGGHLPMVGDKNKSTRCAGVGRSWLAAESRCAVELIKLP